MDDLIGRTVGAALSHYGVSYESVRLIDEPPGRLWGVEIMLKDAFGRQRIVLQIEPREGLFSETRNWPREMVEQQKILRVHESGAGQF